MQRNLLAKCAVVAIAICAVAAQFSAGAATPAMPVCKSGDSVVWVDTKTKLYYMKGGAMYGKTAQGKYMCASAATSGGDHMAKMTGGSMGTMGTMGSPSPSRSSLASPMASTPASLETNQLPNTTSSSSPSP